MDDAKWSVEFLLSQNIYDARVRLDRLVEFNSERKATEQRITDEALAEVNPTDKVLVIAGEDWHEGVVGIVAARVGREHNKPTIILTKGEGGELKGSGRSFHTCNLFKITDLCRPLLSKFGGHAAAIGLSLPFENLEPLREALNQNYLAENYEEGSFDPDILGELSFSHINFNLVNMMKQYEPYGQGNPRPKFITKNVTIEDVTEMGKEKEHRRFSFSRDGVTHIGVLFKTREQFSVGKVVTIVYGINENHFNNRVTLQLMIEKIS
jgi:single-stranded-DNA-specific exonuclease